jgi:predicted hydrocarbon binding protein
MTEHNNGLIQIKVITALLQAYLDILDYDGMKSILKEAGMLEFKDRKDVNPNAYITLSPFKKILLAQDVLLYNSYDLLYTIGKKFSFYLFPFGKSFQESIEELTQIIKTNWDIRILEKTADSINLQVENCIFCSKIDNTCDLFIGFVVHTLEKTLSAQEKVVYEASKARGKSFLLKLKIKKNNKS